MKNRKQNEVTVDEDFFDQTDDLDESEVVYENGEEPEDRRPEEAYEPEDFIWAPYYGVKPLTDSSPDKKSLNNNPWISAGVIVVSIAFSAFLFWLFLK